MTIVKVHLYQFFVEEEDNTFGYKSFGFWQNPDTSLQNIRNTALYCSVVPANRFLCYSADSRRHFSDFGYGSQFNRSVSGSGRLPSYVTMSSFCLRIVCTGTYCTWLTINIST